MHATAATRFYQVGVDEQLMETTGHLRLEGVHSYERTSEDQKEVVLNTHPSAQTPPLTISAVAKQVNDGSCSSSESSSYGQVEINMQRQSGNSTSNIQLTLMHH